MEGIVEENGSVDPLAPSPDPPVAIVSSVGVTNNQSHLMTATNIVQLTLPQTQAQVQSVIQPNQQSVIQTATNLPPVLSKGNVILVSKPNSVIQTAQANLQTLQVVDAPSDDSFSEEESPKKRRDLLTRRPSYRKILNDLGGGEIAVVAQSGSLSGGASEDQARKREMRLLKNREAARECRRKKKEYIKCLENRVAVLENQNKALIDELKSLKELYCQQKTE
ncbi:cyclic amp response element-binding protein b [Holotrichia oblita]|nr:cyclic amp response element-binding protein b [Holotrichia oblita]